MAGDVCSPRCGQHAVHATAPVVSGLGVRMASEFQSSGELGAMTRSTLDTGWTNSHENEPDNGVVPHRIEEQPCPSRSYRNHACALPLGHAGRHSTCRMEPRSGVMWDGGLDDDD